MHSTKFYRHLLHPFFNSLHLGIDVLHVRVEVPNGEVDIVNLALEVVVHLFELLAQRLHDHTGQRHAVDTDVLHLLHCSIIFVIGIGSPEMIEDVVVVEAMIA